MAPAVTMAEQAEAVLHFWFTEVGPERQFAKDDALDAECAARFGRLRDAVVASDAAEWRGDADTLLAAIILIDQISRNVHRGSAAAFAADPLGLELALSGIAAGYHRLLPPDRRAFLYMPLMHAEDRGVQHFALRCFADEGLEKNLDFARAHRDVIERFGRFPGRNAALGRASTPEEQSFLAEGGGNW
ncbi:DUF924 domain-containing protein [Sphingobium sufflavum]|uniref:DUF924 family protein n=1 Tax=Sphingobium sufflavum TaxID=1129547 RepID=UPI001F1B840E|nr:DUF924 family protein [Sphingobium sufflavum]MCE7797809.1 DUF924 domain-containing protein [Sphingobium sufflavum]